PVEAYNFSRGDAIYRAWPFVDEVLQGHTDTSGDKFAGAVETNWGSYFYLVGPVRANDSRLVGLVAVGISLPTLTQQIRSATLAQISLYNAQGELLASPLPPTTASITLAQDVAGEVMDRSAQDSLIREFSIASANY